MINRNKLPSGAPTPETSLTPEQIKKEFSERLQTIIGEELTVENINTYAESILNALIAFSQDVQNAYSKNHHQSTGLSPKALEEAAFTEYGLSDIKDLLNSAGETLQKMLDVDALITAHTQYVDQVITPPDTQSVEMPSGAGNYETRDIIPRLKTLLYILETDFGIDLQSLPRFMEGNVTKDMLRKTSYITVQIPSLHRVVQVCNEEGNVSYVFDTRIMDTLEPRITVEQLNSMSKYNKNGRIEQYPTIGRRLIQTPNWRSNMVALLNEPIQKLDEVADISPEIRVRQAARGELDPWRGFWTDPKTEKHWGGIKTIAGNDKVRKGQDYIRGLIEHNNLPHLAIIDALGRVLDKAYALEDVMNTEKFQKDTARDRAEVTGEWKGFYIDTAGNHFGSIQRIAEKMKIPRVMLDRMSKQNFRLLDISNIGAKKVVAYCFEDMLKDPEIQEQMNALVAEQKEEWKGFYIDNQGRHWGALKSIIYRIVARDKAAKICDRAYDSPEIQKMPTKVIRGFQNKIVKRAYCLEDIKVLAQKIGLL